MDRSQIIRIVLWGAAIFLFMKVGLPAITGKSEATEIQPLSGLVDNTAPPAEMRKEEVLCELKGKRFNATVTSKGAALKQVHLLDPQYSKKAKSDGGPIELVTTWVQSRLPLRTDFRVADDPAVDQVAYNDLDWSLKAKTATSCTYVYKDDKVELEKTVAMGERPFELKLDVSVKNLDATEHAHRLTIEQTDWRTQTEMSGSSFLDRRIEFMTKAEVHGGSDTERWAADDFEAGDFEDAEEFTSDKWRLIEGQPGANWAAVSSAYFTKAVFPLEGPSVPKGEALIEEVWHKGKFAKKRDDPDYGYVFRSRLNYGKKALKTGESAAYRALAYVGPKERSLLAAAGGGSLAADKLLDLGMFGAIGRLLVQYLYWLFKLVGTWGWAIVLLTITIKVLLFPLSIMQIKSGMVMRKLQPEMDLIRKKYKDDTQQQGLAINELLRKNNASHPMLGCLPLVLQMPVWYALYAALQSAVELYHEPFGPFIPDLSSPGKYFIIPAALGSLSFLQQHLMPMQGDQMQRKIMKYMMPAIFTFMMLFLPAGLGIYFLTNTLLGIIQQVSVERYYKANLNKDGNAPEEDSGGDSSSSSSEKRKSDERKQSKRRSDKAERAGA